MMEIPFSSQLAESFSPQSSKENLLNCFAEIDPGRAKIIRRQRHGLTLTDADAAGGGRGIEKLQDNYWLVVGSTCYKWVESTTTLTTLGTINTSTGPVTISTNNAGQIAFCDGVDLWVWDDPTFSQVTESGWSPKGIESLGGYGIIHDSTTKGRFYTTALNDFTTVDSLDFANAEADPDDTVRIIVLLGEAWMFGKTTTEVYRLSGLSFPLAKVTGSEIQRGCAAQFGVAINDNSVFWLGDDLIVYRNNGYAAQRISTHTIERKIAAVATPSAAEAFFTELDGNKFFTLKFPGELTVQFNVTTGLWNQCKTYLQDDWQVVGSAGRSSKYILNSSGICLLDDSVNKDITTTMIRQAISPPLYDDGNRVTAHAYYLDCEVGRTTGTEPSMMLETSRDGESWGNILTRAMGAIGEYRRRVTWRNLGVAREWQFRVSMSDDVPFKIMGAGGNFTSTGM